MLHLKISDKFSKIVRTLRRSNGPYHFGARVSVTVGRPLPGNRFAFAGFSVPGAVKRDPNESIQDPNGPIPGFAETGTRPKKDRIFQNDYTS